MKKIILLLLLVTTSIIALSQVTPYYPPRTPVNGGTPRIIQDTHLRALRSFAIPYTSSNTPLKLQIDSVGFNFQLLLNGDLVVSKGLNTGFFKYPSFPNLGTALQQIRVNSGATALEYFTPATPTLNQVLTAGNSSLIAQTTGASTVSSGAISMTIGADNNNTTKTDNTLKSAKMALPHYLLAEEPFGIFTAITSSTDNILDFGGNTAQMNAGTLFRFWTGANNVTTAGTLRATISNTGLSVAGTIASSGQTSTQSLKLNALNTAPTSATDTGTVGEIRWDANYMYVCTATNTWKRSAITTW